MRSSTIVLTISLLAAPAALLASPPSGTDGLLQLAQATTGRMNAPEQTLNGRPLTDAPVPPPPHGISPAERVASAGSRDLTAGPVNSTPFSAGPTSPDQAGAPGSPNGLPGGDATPNLGR